MDLRHGQKALVRISLAVVIGASERLSQRPLAQNSESLRQRLGLARTPLSCKSLIWASITFYFSRIDSRCLSRATPDVAAPHGRASQLGPPIKSGAVASRTRPHHENRKPRPARFLRRAARNARVGLFSYRSRRRSGVLDWQIGCQIGVKRLRAQRSLADEPAFVFRNLVDPRGFEPLTF